MNDDRFDKPEGLSPVGEAYFNAGKTIHATKMADLDDNPAQIVSALEGIFDMLAQIAFQLEEMNGSREA